ncbi:MAG: hypothetical protein ABIH37_02320 [archaeon]
MVWQDITLTVLNAIFAYSLIPQVYHGFKTKKRHIVVQTAVITTVALYTQTIVFFTLDLFFASIMSSFIAILWTLLLIQSSIYKG